MAEYLGETLFDVSETPFATYQPRDWALYLMGQYGYIDGAHHKDWLLDQVARVLFDTPVIVKQAAWADGNTEWRVELGEPTAEYLEWSTEEEVDEEYMKEMGW